MRVLLIEPDFAITRSIELMLKSEGFNVYTTDLGAEGVDLGKLYDYDLIVLASTPQLTDCDMVRSLRLAKVRSSIIVLLGDSRSEIVVRALNAGADDCLTHPFHRDELIARIHAIVRRANGHTVSVIETGNIVVNMSTKTVTVGGERVHLTTKEYEILEHLSLRKNTTLTKEAILSVLYGGMDEPDIKIIDVFICKLRKKLRAFGGHEIETVWGRGYVLRDPDKIIPEASLAPEIRAMSGGFDPHPHSVEGAGGHVVASI